MATGTTQLGSNISSTGGVAGVSSFNGRTGAVIPVAGDYTASQVNNVPAGNISSLNVQAAINELDSEKQPLSSVLTAWSAFNSNGILVQTALATFVSRSIVAGSTKLSVTNGSGVAGNPTIDVVEANISRNALGGGALSIANGGTASTTAAAARVALNIDQRSTFSNANYVVLSTDRYVAQVGTMTAPRIVTLPLANSVNAGQTLRIVDESGTVDTTNLLTITASGADTIDGTATKVVRSSYGQAELTSNGTNMWFRPVTGIGAGGTGISTTPTNGQLLIGNTTTASYNQNTLTAGPGISIVNGAGTITVTNSSIGVGTLPPGIIGDGVDGNVTIAVNTTLTRDMYYSNLTVNAGVTLTTAGFCIFCSGTITIAATGIIARNGNNGGNAAAAAAGAAGAALAAATTGASGAGAAGAAGGTAAGASGASAAAVSGEGGAGGVGGNAGAGSGGAGGSGGNAGVLTIRYFRNVQAMWKYTAVGTYMPIGTGGGGGAGGGGDTVNSGRGGGGGGSAGGGILIITNDINSSGTIQAKGGTGGNGGAGALGNTGGGAGGGGGGGGKIMLLTNAATALGTLDVSGGTAGNGSAGAGTGSNGSNGSNGANGFATVFNASTGLFTTTS